MLELSLRFVIADETSTDEALIAGLPHDLRAIADQMAERWPGNALDVSLGAGGRLARPARLEVDLAHGGRATIEVCQAPSNDANRLHAGTVNDTPEGRHRPTTRRQTSEHNLDDVLATIVSPERMEALTRDTQFLEALERATQALAGAPPDRARSAVRLMRSFAGHFVDLVAKDRSGYWVRLADASAVDPYYVCAEFQQNGARSRVPLPHLLPEAAESHRSFALSPEVMPVLTLLEFAAPTALAAVRAAGRDYLARRRDWLSNGRYSK